MVALPVIAIFDVGKTNKKLFLFDEQYKIVFERTTQIPEIKDEDGDACEDLGSLIKWLKDSLVRVSQIKEFDIKAINFTSYGASLVHLNEKGEPVAPLYNYLKPYPGNIKKQFYEKYGGEEAISVTTASPVLGSLNSGLQLYLLKYTRPELFNQIKYSLHLPQYLSYLITGKACSDITSIGCHTCLWNFSQHTYHEWVYSEEVIKKLAPLFSSENAMAVSFLEKKYAVGVGLHDSSAALIPYLASFQEPFILISTGTWCISLNPFNPNPLTVKELKQDCLCYMTYQGKSVKASRLFAGYEHEQQVKKLAEQFNKPLDYYTAVRLDTTIIKSLQKQTDSFISYEKAYHHLMMNIVAKQIISTKLVLQGAGVKRIFVDGGFSRNPIYMHLLAKAFPGIEVLAASVPHATAMGAAIAIHKHWNTKSLPHNFINSNKS